MTFQSSIATRSGDGYDNEAEKEVKALMLWQRLPPLYGVKGETECAMNIATRRSIQDTVWLDPMLRLPYFTRNRILTPAVEKVRVRSSRTSERTESV